MTTIFDIPFQNIDKVMDPLVLVKNREMYPKLLYEYHLSRRMVSRMKTMYWNQRAFSIDQSHRAFQYDISKDNKRSVYLGNTVIDKYIFRFNIAMDDTSGMDMLHS